MVAPALLPPAHASDKGHDDCGQASGAVVMNEMSSKQGNETAGEQDEEPEEDHVLVVPVGDPLGQDAPEDAEAETEQNLDGTVEHKLQDGRFFVEGYAQEDAEPADGHHVVGRAGCDNQSWDTLGHAVAALRQVHEAGDDDGGGYGGKHEPQHEPHGPFKVQDVVREDSDRDGFDKAGDEGGSNHHPA